MGNQTFILDSHRPFMCSAELSEADIMGNGHLYWILTDPSCAVQNSEADIIPVVLFLIFSLQKRSLLTLQTIWRTEERL
jgi:hypothetical protein